MYKHLILLSGFILSLSACTILTGVNTTPVKIEKLPSITLQANFTDSNNKIGTIFDFFDVSVRTENGNPKGVPAHFGRKKQVSTVRMLGGWRNQDINGDTYQWDGKKVSYNFDVATQRIDAWLDNDWDIFQIVLDNPPWAFQRGYTFVDSNNGKNYLEKDRVGVYGNGLPPNDAVAWHHYIQAFIKHLELTYGKEQVLSWRFRVGSEIDTRPQHWSGTREQFFEHYKNTVTAVRSVLPTAQIGAHFREGSFKSNYVDYTGNKENSYAVPFIVWAKENNVPYDFIAISYYPHITKAYELDLAHVYQHDIAPIKDHPDFRQGASFEIHEFKFISAMLKAGFVSVSTSHASAFFAMFSKMMLENNITEVFQWGNQSHGNYSADAMTQLALSSMLGNELFQNEVLGQGQIQGNQINAIFSQDNEQSRYDILLYNFNQENFSYQQPETVQLALKVNQTIGTEFSYRIGKINRFNNITDQFYNQYPQSQRFEKDGGWRLADIHFTASTNKLLNAKGQQVFQENIKHYTKQTNLNWQPWQHAEVVANAQGEPVIFINTSIESFGVQQLTIKF